MVTRCFYKKLRLAVKNNVVGWHKSEFVLHLVAQPGERHSSQQKTKTVKIMELSKFEVRTGLWPHMHFTDIEYDHRGGSYEIYATDVTNQTKSKLFICRTTDEQQAKQLAEQFKIWLPKVNSRKRKATAKSALTGYDRVACHKG